MLTQFSHQRWPPQIPGGGAPVTTTELHKHCLEEVGGEGSVHAEVLKGPVVLHKLRGNQSPVGTKLNSELKAGANKPLNARCRHAMGGDPAVPRRARVAASPTAWVLWVHLPREAGLVQHGLPATALAVYHDSSLRGLLGSVHNILEDLVGDVSSTVKLEHDTDWDVCHEVGDALLRAGTPTGSAMAASMSELWWS